MESFDVKRGPMSLKVDREVQERAELRVLRARLSQRMLTGRDLCEGLEPLGPLLADGEDNGRLYADKAKIGGGADSGVGRDVLLVMGLELGEPIPPGGSLFGLLGELTAGASAELRPAFVQLSARFLWRSRLVEGVYQAPGRGGRSPEIASWLAGARPHLPPKDRDGAALRQQLERAIRMITNS